MGNSCGAPVGHDSGGGDSSLMRVRADNFDPIPMTRPCGYHRPEGRPRWTQWWRSVRWHVRLRPEAESRIHASLRL